VAALAALTAVLRGNLLLPGEPVLLERAEVLLSVRTWRRDPGEENRVVNGPFFWLSGAELLRFVPDGRSGYRGVRQDVRTGKVEPFLASGQPLTLGDVVLDQIEASPDGKRLLWSQVQRRDGRYWLRYVTCALDGSGGSWSWPAFEQNRAGFESYHGSAWTWDGRTWVTLVGLNAVGPRAVVYRIGEARAKMVPIAGLDDLYPDDVLGPSVLRAFTPSGRALVLRAEYLRPGEANSQLGEYDLQLAGAGAPPRAPRLHRVSLPAGSNFVGGHLSPTGDRLLWFRSNPARAQQELPLWSWLRRHWFPNLPEHRRGAREEIWVSDLDGDRMRQIAYHHLVVNGPTIGWSQWSRDGKAVTLLFGDTLRRVPVR